ncbi:uncharacterized protein [Littorina saxatilis]|uniref:uncharacterized protein n=1 Tax=Littorina saxatilis TaxID=31220 RepID=UPI0038B44D06
MQAHRVTVSMTEAVDRTSTKRFLMKLNSGHHAATTVDKDKFLSLEDRPRHHTDLLLTACLLTTCILLTTSPAGGSTNLLAPLLHRQDRTSLWRCQTWDSSHPTPSSECSL